MFITSDATVQRARLPQRLLLLLLLSFFGYLFKNKNDKYKKMFLSSYSHNPKQMLMNEFTVANDGSEKKKIKTWWDVVREKRKQKKSQKYTQEIF